MCANDYNLCRITAKRGDYEKYIHLGGKAMRIILDTDKKTITVPWNYAQKLNEINSIIKAGQGTKQYDFKSYIQEAWNACMADTDKHLVVAQKPIKKDK